MATVTIPRICAWCKGSLGQPLQYEATAEEAADKLGSVTHGICPPCYERVMGKPVPAEMVA